MISGAAQADVCLLMVPADGNFTTAIQKGDHKAGEIQGQTRQHARLINLLGVKQLIVGVNKMDSDVAGYKEARYNEIRDEMRHMLVKVGWKPDFVEKSVPVLPISGWMGDNLVKKSEKMDWWKGVDVTINGKTTHIDTLLNALNDMVEVPERKTDAPLRVPISGAYKIKGVGDVLAGRVEQGIVKPGDEVIFLPTHTTANPCVGKVFTVEMHHKRVDKAGPGDNVGMNIKVGFFGGRGGPRPFRGRRTPRAREKKTPATTRRKKNPTTHPKNPPPKHKNPPLQKQQQYRASTRATCRARATS
jgi:elongation factor 1-alpha